MGVYYIAHGYTHVYIGVQKLDCAFPESMTSRNSNVTALECGDISNIVIAILA